MNISPAQLALDLSGLREFSGGEKEIEIRLASAFIKQSNLDMAALEKSYAEPYEAKTWTEAAHSIKGAAANIGADHLSALCHDAQYFEGSAHDRGQLLGQIREEYSRVQKCMQDAGWITKF